MAAEELHIQPQVGLEEAAVEGEVVAPWCVGVLLSCCVVIEPRGRVPKLRERQRAAIDREKSRPRANSRSGAECSEREVIQMRVELNVTLHALQRLAMGLSSSGVAALMISFRPR